MSPILYDAGGHLIEESLTDEEREALADELVEADIDAEPSQCRFCGCTDDAPCPIGCSWISPTLCSACYDDGIV